jgi:microcystin-dependent protein
MSVGVVTWSQTSANNATADTAINWAEGQAPSSVNDSARAMMSSVAKWRDDITGITAATSGGGTAYAFTSNQTFAANADGLTIQFAAGATNTGAVTLSVDGKAALPVRFLSGVDLPAGVIILGSLYQVTQRSSEWLLHASPLATPYLIPLGGMIDFIATTSPNANFALPAGQPINRTTYASLFSLVGTTYGTGDGSTTFNLPDLTGRTVYMKESVASRLTSATVGIDGGTLGATGGGTQTLVTGNLPPYIPTGLISGASSGSDSILVNGTGAQGLGGSGVGYGWSNLPTVKAISSSLSWTGTFSGFSQGGISTPVKMAASGIILNKLLRII